MTISLEVVDYVVIAVYVTVLVGIGMWVSWRRRGSEDLFLAGRSLGWPNVGLSIFGTNVSPSFMIASCGIAFSTGMVTANFEWLAWWFLMLLAMLFVPYYLRTRISTMPQFMKRRFGRATYEFLSWYALFTTIILWLGGTLFASGVLLGQIMGWPVWVSVVVLTVIATSFTVAGGLAAVVITDSFQAILMILGSAVLTVIGLSKVGGITALVEKVPAHYWQLFRPSNDQVYPWHAVVLGYPVMGIWFWCTDQTIVQRVLGARDVRQGQLGAVFAGFLKILTPFIFILPGIVCYALHPELENADKTAFMTMVTTCLGPGMIGLIVAVLIAAVISTIDSGLNSFSTVFTLDIYARRFRPNATEKELKWLGRLATIGAACVAVACALAIGTVQATLFDLLQSIIAFIAPPMAAVFMVGVLWRRATAKAAITALLVGSAVSISVGVCQMAKWPAMKQGVLTLRGADSVEHYEQVLRKITYRNAAGEPSLKPRRIAIVAHGGTEAVELPGATVEICREPQQRFGPFVVGGSPVPIAAEATLESLSGGEIDGVTVTITNLEDGDAEVLWADTDGTGIAIAYKNAFWPHYLLISFYLFAGICALMVVVSLLTGRSPDEEQLPSLEEAYAESGTSSRPVWALWAVLGAIMIALYVGFQALSYLIQYSD